MFEKQHLVKRLRRSSGLYGAAVGQSQSEKEEETMEEKSLSCPRARRDETMFNTSTPERERDVTVGSNDSVRMEHNPDVTVCVYLDGVRGGVCTLMVCVYLDGV